MYGIILLQNETHAKEKLLYMETWTRKYIYTYLYFPSLAHICISLV